MPIFSYLAIPKRGARKMLCAELTALDHCQIQPADNQDIVILVTDTPDERTEKSLQVKLCELQSLQSLSMVFGYHETDDTNDKGEQTDHEN